MNKKRILILGKIPGGFISSNVANYFREKENTLIFYSNNTDLRDREEVRKLIITAEPDVIVHAAAVTSGIIDIIKRPWIHINDNALINSNVLEMAYKGKVKHLVFMSCTVMYSNQFQKFLREDDIINPNAIEPQYLGVASMKLFTENLCKFYSDLATRNGQEFKTTCIRHTNTVGPYDHFDSYNSHVFAALLEKMINTKDGGKISIWGNPLTKKNFIYSKDVCRFIDFVLDNQKKKFEIYNLGGQEVTLNYLVEKMKDVCNKPNIQIIKDTKNAPVPFMPIVSFLKTKELGFKNKYYLGEAIEETYEWRMKNR